MGRSRRAQSGGRVGKMNFNSKRKAIDRDERRFDGDLDRLLPARRKEKKIPRTAEELMRMQKELVFRQGRVEDFELMNDGELAVLQKRLVQTGKMSAKLRERILKMPVDSFRAYSVAYWKGRVDEMKKELG